MSILSKITGVGFGTIMYSIARNNHKIGQFAPLAAIIGGAVVGQTVEECQAIAIRAEMKRYAKPKTCAPTRPAGPSDAAVDLDDEDDYDDEEEDDDEELNEDDDGSLAQTVVDAIESQQVVDVDAILRLIHAPDAPLARSFPMVDGCPNRAQRRAQTAKHKQRQELLALDD